MTSAGPTGRDDIDTSDNGSKKYAIGVAVTHVYGIEVRADSHDAALLRMDSWLRGDVPASELTAKIRSSDLRVVGIGAVAYGRISEVGEISEATRTEMAARGKLPETAWLDVLPPPPRT
jgi:hypothetical protein